MVSFVKWLRRHRLNKNGTTIEFALEALLLNKIWTTRMVSKHISVGYSNTNIDQESLLLQKKCTLTRSVELDILRSYSQLCTVEKPMQ